jgi:DegV family protein with EDD domain
MTHRNISLITDSTCDIPAAWRQQYDIDVIPLTIVWSNEQYLDGVELKPEDFYARLLVDKVHPHTSQPAPQRFLDAFRKAAQNGAQEIVLITISSAMSGTIQAARLAAQESPIPVHIVDSKTNSMGLGWQVIAAARARELGGGVDEMILAAEKARRNMAYYISLDTLEYLVKGGRLGGAAKFVGSVLKIKPLIYVNHETGVVGASLPARSRSGAIEGLIKEYFKHVNLGRPLHITVLHNAALEEAQQLAERVRQEFNPAELFISIVSPILGVHTGPRAIALCGYSEE